MRFNGFSLLHATMKSLTLLIVSSLVVLSEASRLCQVFHIKSYDYEFFTETFKGWNQDECDVAQREIAICCIGVDTRYTTPYRKKRYGAQEPPEEELEYGQREERFCNRRRPRIGKAVTTEPPIEIYYRH